MVDYLAYDQKLTNSGLFLIIYDIMGFDSILEVLVKMIYVHINNQVFSKMAFCLNTTNYQNLNETWLLI